MSVYYAVTANLDVTVVCVHRVQIVRSMVTRWQFVRITIGLRRMNTSIGVRQPGLPARLKTTVVALIAKASVVMGADVNQTTTVSKDPVSTRPVATNRVIARACVNVTDKGITDHFAKRHRVSMVSTAILYAARMAHRRYCMRMANIVTCDASATLIGRVRHVAVTPLVGLVQSAPTVTTVATVTFVPGASVLHSSQHGVCADGVTGNGTCTCDLDLTSDIGGWRVGAGGSCTACYSDNFYGNKCSVCPQTEIVACDNGNNLTPFPGSGNCLESCVGTVMTCNTSTGMCDVTI